MGYISKSRTQQTNTLLAEQTLTILYQEVHTATKHLVDCIPTYQMHILNIQLTLTILKQGLYIINSPITLTLKFQTLAIPTLPIKIKMSIRQ